MCKDLDYIAEEIKSEFGLIQFWPDILLQAFPDMFFQQIIYNFAAQNIQPPKSSQTAKIFPVVW